MDKKKETGFQYQNLGILVVLLLILEKCLKPVLPWEIAEAYSIWHKLMFFAQWAGLIGVFTLLGLYWRVREMNWKSVSRFLIPCTLLYVVMQLVEFGICAVFGIGGGRLSFLKAAEDTGFLSVAIGATLVLWGVSKCRKRYLIFLLTAAGVILGIASGTFPNIGAYPYFERLILGLPILILAYCFDGGKVKNRRMLGAVLFAILPMTVILFDFIGVRGYVGLMTEPQLSYETMYLTMVQGMAGRSVWCLFSVLFACSLCQLIPDRKLPLLSAAGQNAAGAYVTQGLICTILVQANLEWYKGFRDTAGAPFYLLTALVIFGVAANPLSGKCYQRIKSLVKKVLAAVYQPEELAEHIGEQNSYRGNERKILVLLSAFAFAFTFLIFGPYELFLSNSAYLVANFSDVWFPMLAFGLIGFVLLAGILSAVQKKPGDILLSVVAGITAAGYLQGNFMNINLGDLTGTAIVWKEYYEEAVINTLVWSAIIGGILFFYHFNKQLWKGVVKYVSFFILAVQLVAMLSLFLTQDLSDKNDGFFAINQEFELAKEDNIIVFVVDMMDTDYMNEILEENPEFLADYEGFTYYPNCLSRYQRTFPSVPYMLTEVPYQFDEPTQDYFDRAWAKAPHLHQLKSEDYRIQLFGNLKYTAGNGKPMEGLVSNFSTAPRKVPYVRFPMMMLKLLCYRDMPHALKQFFWLYTEDINNVYEDGYRINDTAFYQRMKKKGVTVGDIERQFVLYHLNGSHEPFFMDENGAFVKSGTDEVAQTIGSMKILSDYMEQMKQLGVYEDATIIITADHGDAQATDFSVETLNPTFLMKPKGEQGDFQISNVPVMNSDIWPTVLGEDVVTDEVSNIHLLNEDSRRIRTIYNVWGQDEDIYRITGDAQKLDFWELLESDKIKYDIYM